MGLCQHPHESQITQTEWVINMGSSTPNPVNSYAYLSSLAKTCRDSTAWTTVIDAPVIDAGTAVQRIPHAPWTTSVIKLILR